MLIVNDFLGFHRTVHRAVNCREKLAMQTSLQDKKTRLISALKALDHLAVALSGGVDSGLLLAEAHAVLGDRLIAVTARSPIHPEQEVADAAALTASLDVPHIIVDSGELHLADFLANPPERCYICKKNVFGQLLGVIGDKGFKHPGPRRQCR